MVIYLWYVRQPNDLPQAYYCLMGCKHVVCDTGGPEFDSTLKLFLNQVRTAEGCACLVS